MSENNPTKSSGISQAQSLDEIADFWDTHSLADYEAQTYEVHFEVRTKQRHRISLDPELYARIEAVARMRGVSSETLVNLWLVEHLEIMNVA